MLHVLTRPARALRLSRTLLGLAAGLVLAWSPVLVAGQGASLKNIAVVAHPDVPVDNLTLAELRRILLGDREFWSSGVRVTLLIRAPIAPERDAAVQGVCQMSEAQFRQHWIAKLLRAEAPSGPKIVYSTEMAIDQVSRLPGAITFVQGPITAKNVKVLKIDGHLPGQAGYFLK